MGDLVYFLKYWEKKHRRSYFLGSVKSLEEYEKTLEKHKLTDIFQEVRKFREYWDSKPIHSKRDCLVGVQLYSKLIEKSDDEHTKSTALKVVTVLSDMAATLPDGVA